MGRIATILFAHRLGTSLEPECKMYRLAADIFNDSAMILDCLSPALPKASRVVLLSCSSVLRSLCGVTAGSSKASLSAHFATQGNLGELNAVGPSANLQRYADIVSERLESRDCHFPPRDACRKSCGLPYLVQIRYLECHDCSPRHSSWYKLSSCQGSQHANS